jgi:hypothetical protein
MATNDQLTDQYLSLVLAFGTMTGFLYAAGRTELKQVAGVLDMQADRVDRPALAESLRLLA